MVASSCETRSGVTRMACRSAAYLRALVDVLPQRIAELAGLGGGSDARDELIVDLVGDKEFVGQPSIHVH